MYEDKYTPGEVLSPLADHIRKADMLSDMLSKFAPASRIESDKRLAAMVYDIKYHASEILTTLREVYPDVK